MRRANAYRIAALSGCASLSGCNLSAFGFSFDVCDAAEWVATKVYDGAVALGEWITGDEDPTLSAVEEGIRKMAEWAASGPTPVDARDVHYMTEQAEGWIAAALAAEADGNIGAANAFATMVVTLEKTATMFWYKPDGTRVGWFQKSWLDTAYRIHQAAEVAAQQSKAPSNGAGVAAPAAEAKDSKALWYVGGGLLAAGALALALR